MRSLRDLWQGLSHHPWKTCVNGFVCFSVLWTLTEAVDHFVPGIMFKGPVALWLLVLISVGYAVKRAWKPTRIDVKIANANTSITVLYADLFEQDGIRAIAVNEFFDSAIGKPVSERSVHGQFLQRCFGGHPESFDKQIDEELGSTSFERVTRGEGKERRFPIGSTALVTVNRDRYIAFALTHTDPATCKASADVTMAWTALDALWQRARIECGGIPLNVPLIGGGLSGIGLPTRDLLNLIVLSAITATKAKHVTQQIRIVLGFDRFEDLDLRDVKQHWGT